MCSSIVNRHKQRGYHVYLKASLHVLKAFFGYRRIWSSQDFHMHVCSRASSLTTLRSSSNTRARQMVASHLPTIWEMHPTLGMLQLMLAAQLQVKFEVAEFTATLRVCQDDQYHHPTAAAGTSLLQNYGCSNPVLIVCCKHLNKSESIDTSLL